MRSFSPAQCGHVFLPVHLASKTGGVRLTTFSIAKSRKPIKNCSTGPSLLFFGRKIKVALVGIPALLGMPIFSWSRYAPVFEVEPFTRTVNYAYLPYMSNKKYLPLMRPCSKCGKIPQREASRPEGRTHDIYRYVCECGNCPLQWSVSESAAIRLWNAYVAT